MLKTLTTLTTAAALASTLSLSNTGPAQASADPFMGEIMLFAGNFCPRGWESLEGQLLPIRANTALF